VTLLLQDYATFYDSLFILANLKSLLYALLSERVKFTRRKHHGELK